jgi:tRNA A37 threonylcarbamoyladenosine dehydratase
VVDAIDTVAGKVELISLAKRANIPVISAMGAGNKIDPTAFTVADISKTSTCPLARAMRRELKKRGIEGVKTVYSKEEGRAVNLAEEGAKKAVPASIAFVPSVMGLIIAGEVIKDLIAQE